LRISGVCGKVSVEYANYVDTVNKDLLFVALNLGLWEKKKALYEPQL